MGIALLSNRRSKIIRFIFRNSNLSPQENIMAQSNNRRNSAGGGNRRGRGGDRDQQTNKRTVVKAGGGGGAAARGAGKSKSPVRRVVQGIQKTNESTKSNVAGKKTMGRGRAGRGGRGRLGQGLRRGGGEKKKPLTAEDLDRNMDEYWMKSENKDAALKKLDEAMDDYWEKKGKTAEEGADHANTTETHA
jgi:hypothetical protein